MIVALNKDKNRIFADEADKNSTYYCPYCDADLILKKGTLKIAHFAHKKNCDCISNHIEMSEWHYNWQKYFGLNNAEISIKIGEYHNIADIMIGDTIIEFQHSKISYQEIRKRSIFYSSDNKKLYWIFDCQDEKIQYWKKGRGNNEIYKWDYASNSLLAALNTERTEVFFQLDKDLLIKINWVSFDKKKEEDTLKFFSGIEMTKEECKEYILSKVNFNYVPNPNFKNTDDYWYIGKQYELLDLKLIK